MPYYLAEIYHVPTSPAWFIKEAIIILLITCASPQVSGGAMVCLTILFAQLGIPAEGLGLAGVIATILDFPSTAAKVTGQLMEMTVQADHLDMLDVNTLKKMRERRGMRRKEQVTEMMWLKLKGKRRAGDRTV